MGKKSRSKKGKSKAAGEATSAVGFGLAQDNPQSAPPPGASCWICLEEGPDIHGKPLVRDCSCRGDSGFGHLSCIINYAEKTSEQLGHKFNKKCQELWVKCPNCHQNYFGNLAIDMADAFVAFTEKTFPCHPNIKCPEFPCAPHRYAEALLAKMHAILCMQRNTMLEVLD